MIMDIDFLLWSCLVIKLSWPSSAKNPNWQTENSKWVLCLLQTHVCIQQTALDLIGRGFEVHIVADATSSRSMMDRMFALEVRQILLFWNEETAEPCTEQFWKLAIEKCWQYEWATWYMTELCIIHYDYCTHGFGIYSIWWLLLSV